MIVYFSKLLLMTLKVCQVIKNIFFMYSYRVMKLKNSIYDLKKKNAFISNENLFSFSIFPTYIKQKKKASDKIDTLIII